MPSCRKSSQPRGGTHISYVCCTSTTWEAHTEVQTTKMKFSQNLYLPLEYTLYTAVVYFLDSMFPPHPFFLSFFFHLFLLVGG